MLSPRPEYSDHTFYLSESGKKSLHLMHICDLYSDECVGRTRLARSKVESYDLYIVIIAYFGDILEYTLSLF